MGIFVRLKEFREENGIYQSDLAELFGVNQSTLSRMESQEKELANHQYRALAQKYGAELVSKYVGERTTANITTNRRSPRTANEEALEVIRLQQEEITRLHKRIEELTNLLLKL